MFSGIIQQKGKVEFIKNIGQVKSTDSRQKKVVTQGVRILIRCDLNKFPKLQIGESIAVDGVCLTVIKLNSNKSHVGVEMEVSPETINVCKKNMFTDNPKSVNLERAMRYGDVVGGHLVSGHVDAVGKVKKIKAENEFTEITFKAPKSFAPYLVTKGCVAINGVSLTVNKVHKSEFTVMLIPHTLQETNLGELKTGDSINLESDLMARYILKNK